MRTPTPEDFDRVCRAVEERHWRECKPDEILTAVGFLGDLEKRSQDLGPYLARLGPDGNPFRKKVLGALNAGHEHDPTSRLVQNSDTSDASAPPVWQDGDDRSGQVIDKLYRLIKLISRGGMGDVYQAERIDNRRPVAVKLIQQSVARQDPEKYVAAFQDECAAVARMRHPNIATYIDSGIDHGEPYLVMDLITGGTPITVYCRDRKSGVRARLELLAVVCDAVQHAHDMGVVHRDLSPPNVLVTEFDRRPVPKVIDFGVASLTAQRLADHTPAWNANYIAPERVASDRADLKPADVYSLGVLLYELLTGTTPLGLGDRRVTEVDYRQLMEDLVLVPPSRRLSHAAATGDLHWVRADLDRVVTKSLEPTPANRYETPRSFAEDIRRLLKFEPLSGPNTRSHRAWLFLLRNRWAALLVTALAGGLLGTTLALVRADAARGQEAQARADAQSLLSEKIELLGDVRQAQLRADARAAEARSAYTHFAVDQGVRCAADGDLHDALLWFTDVLARDPDNPAAVRNARTRFAVYRMRTPHLVPTAIITHPVEIDHVEFSPDGRQILCADGRHARVWACDGGHAVSQPIPVNDYYDPWFDDTGEQVLTVEGKEFRVWDTTGNPIPLPAGPTPVRVGRAALSRLKGDVQVLDPATRKPLTPPLTHESEVTRVRFSRDRKRLLTVTAGAKAPAEVIRVWDAGTGRRLGPPVQCDLGVGEADFTRDGTRLLVQHHRKEDLQGVSSSRLFRVWDVAAGKEVSPPLGHYSAHFPSLSPDGKLILTTSDWTLAPIGPQILDIRSVDSNVPLPTFGRTRFPVAARAEYGPGGDQIIATDYTRVQFLDSSGQETALASVHGMGRGVRRFEVSPDGRRVAVLLGSGFEGDNCVVVWTVVAPAAAHTRSWDAGCQVVFAGSGSRVAAIDKTRGIRTWDVITGEPLTPWFAAPNEGRDWDWALSRDGQNVSVRDAERNSTTWQLSTGKPVPLLPKDDEGRNTVAETPDGRRALVAGGEGTSVRVWDRVTGQPLTPSVELPSRLTNAESSHDGRWFLIRGPFGGVRALEAETGKVVSAPLPEEAAADGACFAGRGNLVRFTLNDVRHVWNPERGQVVRLPEWERVGVWGGAEVGVESNPDGTRAVGFVDNLFHIWDVTTGRPLTPTLGDTREPKAPRVRSVEFSPDGQRLLVVSEWSFRVWEAGTGQPLTPPIPYQYRGECRFSSTGDHVVTVDGNSVRVWPVTPDPRPAKDILLLARLLSGHELHASGARTAIPPTQLREILAELRTRYPAEFAVPPGAAPR